MSPGIYTCELAARTGSLGRTLALSLSLLATAKHNNLDSTDISVDARDVTESIWLRRAWDKGNARRQRRHLTAGP